jgi:macrolide-specific efflux system membrane fusion protein
MEKFFAESSLETTQLILFATTTLLSLSPLTKVLWKYRRFFAYINCVAIGMLVGIFATAESAIFGFLFLFIQAYRVIILLRIAQNRIDLKTKAAGDLIVLNIASGEEVKQGALLVQLNASDALKSVRDAQVSLESAQLSLQKLTQPADELSITQSENTLARAKENKANAELDLSKAYDDGFNAVSNAFLELPGVMSGLQDILFTISPASTGSDGNQQNIDFYASAAGRFDDRAKEYRQDAYDKYMLARTSYDKNFQDYKSLGRTSSSEEIEKIITESYETTKVIADATKSTNNLIQFYKDKLTEKQLKTAQLADTHLTLLSGYTSKTNTHLGTLLNAGTSITSNKTTITNSERTINENTLSLAKLKSGADALDVESSNISVTQRKNALLDAQSKLADYSIRAPFTGTIAKVSVKKGDSLSSGATVGTLITKQKIAEVSLNEVDIAKVAIGQKTTLTFDAVDGLSISGEVIDLDTIGTVSQGVVSYTVKISFDTDDVRIKPGMSVSAAIITNVKQDVLTVPSSAVKTSGENSYVEMFVPALDTANSTTASQGIVSLVPPTQTSVTVGDSNDTSTEIISGLKEGDQVVTRTISASAQTTQTTAVSLFGGGGGNNRGVRTGAP